MERWYIHNNQDERLTGEALARRVRLGPISIRIEAPPGEADTEVWRGATADQARGMLAEAGRVERHGFWIPGPHPKALRWFARCREELAELGEAVAAHDAAIAARRAPEVIEGAGYRVIRAAQALAYAGGLPHAIASIRTGVAELHQAEALAAELHPGAAEERHQGAEELAGDVHSAEDLGEGLQRHQGAEELAGAAVARSRLPIGAVLCWNGEPAVIHEAGGWRYVTGRYLSLFEVEDLDSRPYTVGSFGPA